MTHDGGIAESALVERTILGMPAHVFVPFALGAFLILMILVVVLGAPPPTDQNKNTRFPVQTMKILRVIVALAGASLAGGFVGLIGVDGTLKGIGVQATGGFAVFVMLLLSTKNWAKE